PVSATISDTVLSRWQIAWRMRTRIGSESSVKYRDTASNTGPSSSIAGLLVAALVLDQYGGREKTICVDAHMVNRASVMCGAKIAAYGTPFPLSLFAKGRKRRRNRASCQRSGSGLRVGGRFSA